MCLAQGHNAAPPVRFEPLVSSQVLNHLATALPTTVVVSLSNYKTLYPLPTVVLVRQYCKIVDWEIKHQHKQNLTHFQ